MHTIYKYLFCVFVVMIYFSHSYSKELEITRNGNLRAGPSTSHEIIGKVTVGMKVAQIEKDENWFKVKLPDNNTGWIHKILITKVKVEADEEAKYIDKIIQECILLVSLPQTYAGNVNIFNSTEKRKRFAKTALSHFIQKYRMGKLRDYRIMPGDAEAAFYGIWVYTSQNTWFDPISITYEQRGNFPELQMRKSMYQIYLLNNEKMVDRDEDQDINGMKVEIEDGTEVRIKGVEWAYKEGQWIKLKNDRKN
ncbi:MAG: SH3 domain-containing protein [Candidatus Lokiarchaeota archaeon]|nr:SH3 domain-containing protein [Candidatus Lokiarchaeota archaeon]